MKKLLFALLVMVSSVTFSETLKTYITNNLEEVCSSGETISINDLNTLLNKIVPRVDDGCSLYSSKIYDSIEKAGMSSNDGYEGAMLSVKLLSNYNASIKAASFTMRNIPLCIKKYDNGDITIGYQITALMHDSYPEVIYENKQHIRKSIIQISDNKIAWAGQTVGNHTRQYFVQRDFSSYAFRCGNPK